MSALDDLDPADRDRIEAEIARARAAAEVKSVGGDLSAPTLPGYDLRAQLASTQAPAPAPPARGITIEEANRLRDGREAAEVEDFEAFWTARKPRPPKALRNVLGIDLVLPADGLPLQFEIESRRLQTSSDERDVAHLFDMLYGAGSYATLLAKGLDADRFGVLLLWGSLNGNGIDCTLAEAATRCEEMKSARGKALLDQAASGTTSPATGPS